MRTILVCGGRTYGKHCLKQRVHLIETLDAQHALKPITLLVHGDAEGADRLAKRWAQNAGVPEQGYPADWDDIDHPDAVVRTRKDGTKYDVTAGFRRNDTMLVEHPEIEDVIAFEGGRGTAHMTELAAKRGKNIILA